MIGSYRITYYYPRWTHGSCGQVRKKARKQKEKWSIYYWKAELGTCPNMLRVLSILYVPTAIDRALETHLFLAASSSLLVLVLVECKRQVIANDFDIPVICHHSTKYLSGGFVKRVCNLFSAD